MGNEESNTLQMLKYLNPTFLRIFIQPSVKWRDFISNIKRAGSFSSQLGLAFDGSPVVDTDTFKAAVGNFRSSAGSKPFFDWLYSRNEADWAGLMKKLATTEPGVSGE